MAVFKDYFIDDDFVIRLWFCYNGKQSFGCNNRLTPIVGIIKDDAKIVWWSIFYAYPFRERG